MISRLSLRHRPIKIVYRLVFNSPAFKIPFLGWWRITCVAAGGGSGATHVSYATPSERGSNGQLYNPGTQFVRSLSATVSLGAGGSGGDLTNNSDIAAQQGKVGGDSDPGIGGALAGGSGGRCAYEASGLNPSPMGAPYPGGVDDRTVFGGYFLGFFHYGGGISSLPGRGAPGNSAPGTPAAGQTGENGRADYYLRG